MLSVDTSKKLVSKKVSKHLPFQNNTRFRKYVAMTIVSEKEKGLRIVNFEQPAQYIRRFLWMRDVLVCAQGDRNS